MADQDARREARRQKILRNSENRLNRVLGRYDQTENEAVSVSNGPQCTGLPSDISNDNVCKDITLPSHKQSPADADSDTPSNRVTSTDEQATPIRNESPRQEGFVRQRGQNKPTPEDPKPVPKPPPAEATRLENSKSETGSGGTDILQKDVTDPIKLLDLMRCGGCLLTAFLTRWALGFGFGILFLKLVLVPFILLEIGLYYFLTTHMKDVQLPHKNSMMTYALVLSGVKPDVIAKYNMIMGYFTAVAEDFALYLFTFLLFHAVIA